MPSERDILITLARTLDVTKTMAKLAVDEDAVRHALESAAAMLTETESPDSGGGPLTIYTDGASRGNPGPAGAGFVIYRGDKLVEGQAQYLGEVTNNQAEYNALILALERALALGAQEVLAKSDSELMVKQLKGQYRVKDAKLKPLFARAKELIGSLSGFSIEHLRRDGNSEADGLANRAIDEFQE